VFGVCERGCVCVFVFVTDRGTMCVCVCVSVCVRETVCMWERDRYFVFECECL